MSIFVGSFFFNVPKSIPFDKQYVIEDIGIVDDIETGRDGAWAKSSDGRFQVGNRYEVTVNKPGYLTK